MSLKDLVLGGVAVLALVVALGVAGKPAQVIKEVLGSASSPSVIDGCMDVNGFTSCYHSQGMREASTTCSFKSPTATSSLVYAGAKFLTSNVSGTLSPEWGIANTAFATTTSLGYAGVVVTNGNQVTVIASTTPVDLSDPVQVIAPNQWVNLKIGSSSPDNLTGRCSVEFRVI